MEQSESDRKRTGETPRIYVVSLADHNAGRLHGRWIDADQPAETVHEQIAQRFGESEEPIAAAIGADFGARPPIFTRTRVDTMARSGYRKSTYKRRARSSVG